MPSSFPTSPDDIQNDVANSTLEVDTHPGLHNQLADAVMAIETELLPGGTMNLGAHVAAADPHPGYLTQTEGDARYSTIAAGVPDGSITSAKIADGTIVAGDLADGAVTSAKILDGTIATADLANGAVTNAKLAADTARANLLTNGGMEVWQRGVGPFTTSGAWSSDRWSQSHAGTDTLSVSRDTTNIDSAFGSKACAAIAFVLGSGAGGTYFSNNLSASADGLQVFNRVLSISLRVRTATANAVRVGLYTGSAFVYSAYHSGSGVYETLTATATMGASGAAAGQVSVNFAASCTAYIDNAMLVVGSVPAEYAPLHPADDLARCQRYYEVRGPGNVGTLIMRGYQQASEYLTQSFPFKATKAVTPTVTKNGTWVTLNCGQPTIVFVDTPEIALGTQATGTGPLYTYNLGAGCDIRAEANP